jgi:transcriptional regulator with XRE-family HTH domain
MRKPTQQQLGRRLAELRKRAKLTQGDVAEKLGVADETLSRIERGAQWTDFATLVALCELYDAEWADLVPRGGGRNSAHQVAVQRVVDLLAELSVRDVELVHGITREVAARNKAHSAPRGKAR